MTTRTTAEHGTYAGAIAHQRHSEKPCDPCRKARNAYVASWRRQTGNYPSSRSRRASSTPAPDAVIRGAQNVAAAQYVRRVLPAGERLEILLALGIIEGSAA